MTDSSFIYQCFSISANHSNRSDSVVDDVFDLDPFNDQDSPDDFNDDDDYDDDDHIPNYKNRKESGKVTIYYLYVCI